MYRVKLYMLYNYILKILLEIWKYYVHMHTNDTKVLKRTSRSIGEENICVFFSKIISVDSDCPNVYASDI